MLSPPRGWIPLLLHRRVCRRVHRVSALRLPPLPPQQVPGVLLLLLPLHRMSRLRPLLSGAFRVEWVFPAVVLARCPVRRGPPPRCAFLFCVLHPQPPPVCQRLLPICTFLRVRASRHVSRISLVTPSPGGLAFVF